MNDRQSERVHQTAVIDRDARVHPQAEIGPYCVIGPSVEIGAETRVGPHTVITGPTRIGRGNTIYGQSSLGSDPQDLKYRGEESTLQIGDENLIREFVTINRGTEGGGWETVVGSRNLLMTGVHIAHDCRLGNGIIMANSATLAGHIVVGDNATVGAFSAVQQFCRVGYRAFIGGYSVITRDALPFVKTVGSRGEASIFGINTLGLERAGYSAERVSALKTAYRILFAKGLRVSEAIGRIRAEGQSTEDVEILLRFIEDSEKGFVR